MRFPKSLLGWFPRRQAKRRLAAQRRQSLPLAAERFEERTLLTDLVLDGATTLLVTATGPASGTYSLDGSTPVTFTDIDSFTFNGDANDNQLTIINPSGSLFAPAGGITYNGAGQTSATNGDRLQLLGGGGAGFSGSYTPGAVGAGVIVHTNGTLTQTVTFTGLEPVDDTTTEDTFVITAPAGAAQTINVIDGPSDLGGGVLVQTTQVNETANGFELINFANKTSVTVLAGDEADTLNVNVTTAAAGLTTLIVDSGVTTTTDGDVVNVQATPTGVITTVTSSVTILDESDDVVTIGSATAGLSGIFGAVNVDNVDNFTDLTVDDRVATAARTVTLSATSIAITGLGTISYVADDLSALTFFGSTGGNTITVSDTPTSVVVDGLTTTINAGNSANNPDTVTVQATTATNGDELIVNTQAGNDIVNLGNASNQVDAIQAPVSIDGGSHDLTATITRNVVGTDQTVTSTLPVGDTINYNDQGTATPNTYTLNDTTLQRAGAVTPATVTFSNVESITVSTGLSTDLDLEIVNVTTTPDSTNVTINTTAGGDAVNIATTGADSILTVNGDTGSNTVQIMTTGAGSLTFVNSGAGDDLLSIASNGVGAGLEVHGDAGDDSLTVTVDALGAGSVTVLNGDNDNDLLTAEISTAAAQLAADAALDLNGGAGVGGEPSDSSNRDTVRIELPADDATTRSVTFDYADVAGSLTVAGLGATLGGGSGSLIYVYTAETVLYFGGDENDDDVTVVGTSADDDLTVALVPDTTLTTAGSSALVFLGGTSYTADPPNQTGEAESLSGITPSYRPGVAGGGTAPDLLLNGLQGDLGLTVDGAGTSGEGNRLIVQAASESNIPSGGTNDLFGFGSGILIPGFGLGNAYDAIEVTDERITVTNNFAGDLVRVNPVTDSFVQTSAASATQRPALIINGGDESAVQANNLADNVTVAVSSHFNIQVNGNLPGSLQVVTGTDGLPAGDQLNVTGTGDLNLFSDLATPPVLSIAYSGNPSPFVVQSHSIERVFVDVGSGTTATGIVNLIGDNNSLVGQQDVFEVVGRDVDGGVAPSSAANEMSVSINNSAPILIRGVQFLNVSGGNAVDTLKLTAYADNGDSAGNSPRGWDVQVTFDEGDPSQSDGGQNDLLVYNTVAANAVSEEIVVQPSGPEAGELRVTNAVDGSVIVVVNYINNLDLIVNDNDGFASDVDSLTLRGTDGSFPTASGHETVVVNFQAAGDAANPQVTVTDTNTGDFLYRLRQITGFSSVNFELDAPGVTTLTALVDGTSALVHGTSGDDLLSVSSVGVVSLTNALGQTDAIDLSASAAVTLNLLGGTDEVSVTATNAFTLSVRGGDPAEGDALLLTGAATTIETVVIAPSTTHPAEQTVTGLGSDITVSGMELIRYTGQDGNDTLMVNPGSGDHDVRVSAHESETTAQVTSDSLPEIRFTGLVTFTLSNTEAATLVAAGLDPDTDYVFTNLDQVLVQGSEADDTVTAVGSDTLTLGTTSVTLRSVDRLTLQTLGGNDDLVLTGFTAASVIVQAGDGDDTVVGTGGSDLIFGGSGDDILVGGDGDDFEYGEDGNDIFGNLDPMIGNGIADDAGNDDLFGGDGIDRFVWEPGDGTDLINGGDDGADILRVFGTAGTADNFTVQSAFLPTHLNVVLGSETVDAHGVEQLLVIGQTGDDTVTINDLSATEIEHVSVSVSGGDADVVIVNGRAANDNLLISTPTAGEVNIVGLSYDIRLANVTTADLLTVNGRDGHDVLKAVDGVEDQIQISLTGGAGDDLLSADATLQGDAGNDTLTGGTTDDSLDGGDGNDVLEGRGGDDILNGGAGTDRVVATGDVDFTLTDTSLGGLGSDTLASLEEASLTGGDSANTFIIGEFSGLTILVGGVGSDTIDFSTALAAINFDLDVIGVAQVINLARRRLQLGDALENLIATSFSDLIHVDIGAFDRLINGGIESSIRPGDQLIVDVRGLAPSTIKGPNGTKMGSLNGTVNATGYVGTITYVDIETLSIKNGVSNSGSGGSLFVAATDYLVGKAPRGVVTGDVNGDGFEDMVAVNASSRTVSVRFGDGFGGFDLATHFPTGGKTPTTAQLADVDGDGNPDIVVVNSGSSNLAVLLNDGLGTFGTPTLFRTGSAPFSVKLEDLDGDLDLDAVTANNNSHTVSILLSNGDGTFASATHVKTGGKNPRDLVIGNFDGDVDGTLDIVVANTGSRNVSLLSGDGAGNFVVPPPSRRFAVGISPTSIVAADFNADGKLDVVVVNQKSNHLSVLLGNVAGVGPLFREERRIHYPGKQTPISVQVGDFNDDGNVDLVVANRRLNTVSVLFGIGNGSFTTPLDFSVGDVRRRQPVSMAVGDFDKNGTLDVIVANGGTNDVSVLLRNPLL